MEYFQTFPDISHDFISFQIDERAVPPHSSYHKYCEIMQSILFLFMKTCTTKFLEKEVRYCEAHVMCVCNVQDLPSEITSIWTLIRFCSLCSCSFFIPLGRPSLGVRHRPLKLYVWIVFWNHIADIKYNAIRLIRRRRWLCLSRTTCAPVCVMYIRRMKRNEKIYMYIRKTNYHIYYDYMMETIWW